MSSENSTTRPLPVNLVSLGRHYAAIQGLYWATIACTAAYAVVLLQSRGITNTQVGIVMACRSLASFILQPFVASMADRLHHKIPLKFFSLILIIIAFISNAALFFTGGSFPASIIIFMILGASESVLAPINDSLAIQYINGGYPLNYSVARGFGSLLFAVNCLALSGLVKLFGVESTLVLHAFLLIVMFLVLMTFRNYTGPVNSDGERARPVAPARKSYRQILKDSPAMIVFLAAAFCLMIGASSSFQYLPNFLARSGGDSSLVGIALFVLAAVQFPTSLFYARIARRFSTRTLLLVAYSFIFIRCMLVMTVGSPALIIGVMVLDLFGGGLQISSEVFFINDNVGTNDMVKGQSLLRIIPGGIGAMLGSLLAGYLIDKIGLGGMTIFSGGAMLTGVLIFLTYIIIRRLRREPRVT